MLPLIDRPSIDFIVNEFVASGINNIAVITSRRKQALDNWFDRDPEIEALLDGDDKLLASIRPVDAHVQYIRQREMCGTGHALLLAMEFVGNEPCVVAYPDDIHIGSPPLSAQLIDVWNRHECAVLATVYDPPDLNRYGILKMATDGFHVEDIVEKPTIGQEPSREASIGRFLYPPAFFRYLREGWERHVRNTPQAEYYHVYALRKLIEDRQVVCCRLTGMRLDMGTPEGYLRSIVRYALNTPAYRTPLLEEVARYREGNG